MQNIKQWVKEATDRIRYLLNPIDTEDIKWEKSAAGLKAYFQDPRDDYRHLGAPSGSGAATASGTGWTPYYFKATKKNDTQVTISNIRYAYGLNMGTMTDQDISIPTTNGVYYVHFQALYYTSYTFSIEAGTLDTHPDQSDDTGPPISRAYREEIAAVTVAGNVISSIAPIWPGGIMAIKGRVV